MDLLLRTKSQREDYSSFEEFSQDCKEVASRWATKRLKENDVIYIDLETTGLPSGEYVPGICQLSILNWKGQPLFSALLDPEEVMKERVSNIHKIYNEDVLDSPKMSEIASIIAKLVDKKTIIAYNAAFDIKILTHHLRSNLKGWSPNFLPECLMLYYSAWIGSWSTRKKDFKWQKLPKLGTGQAHDALVDAQSAIELMKIMAYGKEQQTETIDLNF